MDLGIPGEDKVCAKKQYLSPNRQVSSILLRESQYSWRNEV